MDQWFKYAVELIMMPNRENLEQRNIKLQQRVYDLKWTILSAIELINKGNVEKAMKLLKKAVYEKWLIL